MRGEHPFAFAVMDFKRSPEMYEVQRAGKIRDKSKFNKGSLNSIPKLGVQSDYVGMRGALNN